MSLSEMYYCNNSDRRTRGGIQLELQSVSINGAAYSRDLIFYRSDDDSAELFKQAGVKLRRHNPNTHMHIDFSAEEIPQQDADLRPPSI